MADRATGRLSPLRRNPGFALLFWATAGSAVGTYLAALALSVDIFDRTGSSGLARGQYLAVSLSAASEWQGRSRAELRREFLPAFEALFPAAREAKVETFFATCEPAATFLQRPGTARWRPGPRRSRGIIRSSTITSGRRSSGWSATTLPSPGCWPEPDARIHP